MSARKEWVTNLSRHSTYVYSKEAVICAVKLHHWTPNITFADLIYVILIGLSYVS